MKCAQCDAFESAFKAGVRFADATYALEEKTNATLLQDAAFLLLEREVSSARIDYQMARKALQVHKEGHKKP